MPESRAREIARYSFLVAFANDGKLDENELGMIKRLALEDGVVDDDERRVLRNLFERVDVTTLSDVEGASLAAFRRDLGF